MVLVVVAHVEAKHVKGPIVTVGLLPFVEHVVLGDKMARHRVEAHGQKGSCQQVHQSPHWDTDKNRMQPIEIVR